MFPRDIHCTQKFCDVNITSENMSEHFSKIHVLKRESNCPCCPRFFSSWKALKNHRLRMQSDETDDSVTSAAFQLEGCVNNFPENFFSFFGLDVLVRNLCWTCAVPVVLHSVLGFFIVVSFLTVLNKESNDCFDVKGNLLIGVLIEPVGQMHQKLLCRSEFFVARSVFLVFTAIFRNAMLIGGARAPTTCSIEFSYRFWCFVYISHHWKPCLCLGAIFMSAQFRRLVFLRFIFVFLDNHTNFQCHVFHGTMLAK